MMTLEPSLLNVAIVVALGLIPQFPRIARRVALSERNQDYALASRVSNDRASRTLVHNPQYSFVKMAATALAPHGGEAIAQIPHYGKRFV